MTQIWTAHSGTLVRRGYETTDPWSEANVPWVVKAGEALTDGMPPITVMEYADYSSGNTLSFGATMTAMRAAATGPYIAHIPAGTYHITDFSFGASGGYGKGWQDVNGTKRFAGMLGDGAGSGGTRIVVDPSIMTATQYNAVASGSPSPVQIGAIFMSEGNLIGVPTFISGIDFCGNFQQTITLSGSGSSPAPYYGLSISSPVSGSIIQFCRFRGFGFAARNQPPYETGAIQSGHGTYTIRRTEIDGRLAADINSAQPVSSGGLMWNYENSASVVDSWLHHTRRSGFAQHDHSPSEGGGNGSDPGVYYVENFQVDNIANTSDSYASSGSGFGLGFAVSNIEELRKTFTYVRPRFTGNAYGGNYHIAIAVSSGNTMSDGVSVTDPIIGDTIFGGCLAIRVVRHPGGGDDGPWYSAYQSGGLAALPITVVNNGITLTPVLSTSFNAGTNNPANSYVVLVS